MRTTVGNSEIETLTGLYGEPLYGAFLNLLSRDDLYRHSLIGVFLLSNMNPPHLSTMCPTVGNFEEIKPMSEFVTLEVHTEFEKRIQAEDDRQNKRIELIEQKQAQISELVASVKVLAANVESIAKEINEQGIRLKEIEGKPAKRWETVVSCIITGLIGAAITYIFTH